MKSAIKAEAARFVDGRAIALGERRCERRRCKGRRNKPAGDFRLLGKKVVCGVCRFAPGKSHGCFFDEARLILAMSRARQFFAEPGRTACRDFRSRRPIRVEGTRHAG